MNYLKYIVVLLVFTSHLAAGQISPDSLILLDEVEVEVNRFKNYSVGSKIQVIDSSVLQDYKVSSLAELLSQQSTLFVKSYGQNGIGSVSIRGTGAAHTSVLWNGFPIQSPTLGQSDFSLIPVASVDELYIQYGGGGALYGSGSIGATIHMINTPKFNRGVKASVINSNSSFSENYQGMSFSLSKKRVMSSIKVFNHYGKNNYSYLFNNEKLRWQNAAIRQYGILQENFILLSDKQQLNFRIWWQENDRDVPISNEALIKANYKNNFLRLSSEWKNIGDKKSLFVRQAYYNDYTCYTDDKRSVTRFQTSITEVESKFFVKNNQSVNVGVNNTFNHANSDKFIDNPIQNRLSFFASYKVRNVKDNIRLTGSLRKEFVRGFTIPFVPSVGFEGIVSKWLTVKSTVSKTYRVPTFNDMYWVFGGNLNLKPENGWSEEIGVVTSIKNKSFKGTNELTFFNSNVSNWIIWLPSYGSIWAPQNMQYVWARGLEESIALTKQIKKVKLGFTASYSYVVSTNEKVKSKDDKSLHKQLIFVPIYSGLGNFTISYKSFTILYNQTYTGNRFASSDNSSYLKGYSLGNLMLSNTFKWNDYALNVLFKINNLWNVDYRVIPQNPMPLRYYQFSISILYK